MIVVQFFLIILNKQSINSRTYLFTEIIFKTLLALYIEYILYTSIIGGIDWEDKIIIGFSAGLLMFDAFFHDLPVLLNSYGINYEFT